MDVTETVKKKDNEQFPSSQTTPERPAQLITTTSSMVSSNVQSPKTEEPPDLEEDEVSQHMTQSYSEISFKSGQSPDSDLPILSNLDLNLIDVAEQYNESLTKTIPNTGKPLRPLNLDGSVRVEGNMTHFVAEDLETKIKLSSPVAKKSDISNRQLPLGAQMPQGHVDLGLINDLECEAQRMATSVDNLIENLSGILHSVSSITADNVDIYKNAVSKMSDAMDGNIKSMYTMMAKAEEITQHMKGVELEATKIKEIKKLVDLFESFL